VAHALLRAVLAIVPTLFAGIPNRSHDCERGTQDCVRHPMLAPIKWIHSDWLSSRIAGAYRRIMCPGISAMRLRGVILTRMSNEWFARPVLFVEDIDTAVEFYGKQLGFTQAWRYEEEGKARVAQVDRQGCQLILTSQWPDKVGKGLIFISLDGAVLNALRAELEGRGVAVKDGEWGYRIMIVADPDGNQLYFPYPSGPHPSRA